MNNMNVLNNNKNFLMIFDDVADFIPFASLGTTLFKDCIAIKLLQADKTIFKKDPRNFTYLKSKSENNPLITKFFLCIPILNIIAAIFSYRKLTPDTNITPKISPPKKKDFPNKPENSSSSSPDPEVLKQPTPPSSPGSSTISTGSPSSQESPSPTTSNSSNSSSKETNNKHTPEDSTQNQQNIEQSNQSDNSLAVNLERQTAPNSEQFTETTTSTSASESSLSFTVNFPEEKLKNLHAEIKNKNFAKVKDLLSDSDVQKYINWIDPNPDNKGCTVLHLAALANDLEIATLLINNGARACITNKGGSYPFSLVSENEKELRKLLEDTKRTHENQIKGVQILKLLANQPLNCISQAEKNKINDCFEYINNTLIEFPGIAQSFLSSNIKNMAKNIDTIYETYGKTYEKVSEGKTITQTQEEIEKIHQSLSTVYSNIFKLSGQLALQCSRLKRTRDRIVNNLNTRNISIENLPKNQTQSFIETNGYTDSIIELIDDLKTTAEVNECFQKIVKEHENAGKFFKTFLEILENALHLLDFNEDVTKIANREYINWCKQKQKQKPSSLTSSIAKPNLNMSTLDDKEIINPYNEAYDLIKNLEISRHMSFNLNNEVKEEFQRSILVNNEKEEQPLPTTKYCLNASIISVDSVYGSDNDDVDSYGEEDY